MRAAPGQWGSSLPKGVLKMAQSTAKDQCRFEACERPAETENQLCAPHDALITLHVAYRYKLETGDEIGEIYGWYITGKEGLGSGRDIAAAMRGDMQQKATAAKARHARRARRP
jgi:hypothetical protein